MTTEQNAATLVLALRKWIGATQKEFGVLLRVSRGRVSQWETKADDPPTGMLVAMSNMCPDAKGRAAPPGAPRAKDFLRLAGVYRARSDSLDMAIARITEFIRKVAPDKAEIVELQSRSRGADEQLERALEMLERLVPDVRESSEIPGMSETEAEWFKKLYAPGRRTGRKGPRR